LIALALDQYGMRYIAPALKTPLKRDAYLVPLIDYTVFAGISTISYNADVIE
jgi:hypothetical protein